MSKESFHAMIVFLNFVYDNKSLQYIIILWKKKERKKKSYVIVKFIYIYIFFKASFKLEEKN